MRRSLATLGLILLLTTQASAGDWPQWRGPTGQGYSDDARVPLTWSEKENLLWKAKLPGGGHSTPVVWGDRVFLTAANADGSERYVVCVRASDGETLWKETAAKGVAAERKHEWNTFASPSCTTDGKHVYAFFGTPGFFCYTVEGKLVWKHSFGVFSSEANWGIAASPFLYEDLVIQNCDNDAPVNLPAGTKKEDGAPQALVALDKLTGKVKWTTPRDQGRGFSTPRLIPVAGGRLDLVLNGPRGVWGYDPATGKERWRCTRTDARDQMRFGEPLPVSDDATLFVLSGRPGPWQALKLPDAGDVTKKNVVWSGNRQGHRDVGSPILVKGHVYACDNKGTLSCYDLKTGKEVYTERLGNGRNKGLSSLVLVRGHILVPLDDGSTVVVEPGPTFKKTGVNKLGDGGALDFGASPAIADGRLFLRSQTHLYCIGEKK